MILWFYDNGLYVEGFQAAYLSSWKQAKESTRVPYAAFIRHLKWRCKLIA